MRNGRHFKGSVSKTIFSSLFAIVLISAFVYIALYSFIDRFVADTYLDELIVCAENIVASEIEYSGTTALGSRVDLYEAVTGATVMIFRDSGNGVTTTADIVIDELETDNAQETDEEINAVRARIINAIDRYNFERVLSGETIRETGGFEFSSATLMIAGVPGYAEDGSVAFGVMIARSVGSLFNKQELLLRTLIVVFIGVIPVMIYYVFKLLHSVFKPLNILRDGAKRLADGDYGSLIEMNRNDEIGEVSVTLNTLSKRLKTTFERLETERDRLERVISNMADGVIAVDWFMNTTHYNDKALEMLELGFMPSKLVKDNDFTNAIKKAVRDKSTETAYVTMPSGRKISAISTPIKNKYNMVVGAVCLLTDVSEYARLEQLRRDYIANISHELKTPLTGIRGMVEPLMDGIFSSEEERQNSYAVIYNETLRLEKLILEMLDISRLQDGRVTIETEPVIINVLLEEALRRVENTAKEQGVTLKYEPSNDELTCIGNEDRIIELATIFLDNALSFTPKGGTVTLFAGYKSDRLAFGVTDTGSGIEPKDLPYIFERFYKADRARTHGGGTGLGLAIAKLIVEHMNGTISAVSKPGQGSTFTVELPRE